MSTLKTTYLQHPSSATANITLNADGTVNLSGYTFSERVVYESNATWTKADYSGLKAVRVTCVGGGGGGGGGTATDDRMGGGGGGGALAQSFILAASLGATETVTVGAGGTGGVANTTGGAGDGSDGTDSSFGTAVVADGGYGGVSQATGYSSEADGGLVASSTGDFKVAGGPGGRGVSSGGYPNFYGGGRGGDSQLGFGGKARVGADPTWNGGLYGGGGGGGGQPAGATHQPGSDGGDGVVIVDIFV